MYLPLFSLQQPSWSSLPSNIGAQTFRGGISGTVTDSSGAVISGAQVTLTEDATNTVYKTISSSAGEFLFNNISVGSYTVSVTASGFQKIKIDKIPITAASVYNLPIKLAVASQGETVEVTADSLTIDTATDTQTTALPEEVVQTLPNSGRDFTQMLSQDYRIRRALDGRRRRRRQRQRHSNEFGQLAD